MATLVLTAIGGLVAGPVGAALGALAGQAVDRDVLFRPSGRQGPRLSDLSVQTSSYGTPLPLVFGTMRVAGTVIWATDLSESRSTGSAGKGQPSVTTYSYSVRSRWRCRLGPCRASGGSGQTAACCAVRQATGRAMWARSGCTPATRTRRRTR